MEVVRTTTRPEARAACEIHDRLPEPLRLPVEHPALHRAVRDRERLALRRSLRHFGGDAELAAEKLCEIEAPLSSFDDPVLRRDGHIEGFLTCRNELNELLGWLDLEPDGVDPVGEVRGVFDQRVAGAVDADDDQLAPRRLRICEPLQ